MKNDYTLLLKENKLRAACLKEENQTALRRMFQYLEGKGLNAYDNAVIQKEVISMALAAEVKHQPLKDMLGMSEQEFCDNLAREGRKMGLADRVAFYLPSLVFVIFMVYLSCMMILLIFGSLGVSQARISVGSILFHGVYFLVFIVFGVSCWGAKGIYWGRWRRGLYQVSALLLLWALMGFLAWTLRGFPERVFEVPWTIYVAFWCALWLLSEWYQKKRAADLAADWPWVD